MQTSVIDQIKLAEATEYAVGLFDRYVRIDSTSSEASTTVPSTPGQWDMLRAVARDLENAGVSVIFDEKNAFLYGIIAANQPGTIFGIGAHVDSSPQQSGTGVEPVYHSNYDGGELRFPKNKTLVLSPLESPELLQFKGDTIITASGDTLLSADDKAGVAAIVAAARMWQSHPQLPHPEIRIFITRDEEIGIGVDGIDIGWLPRFCYTIDAGILGELEHECFDAMQVKVTLEGVAIHPGYAYGKMINASLAAGHLAARLNRNEMPETTKDRQGFTHLRAINGDAQKTEVSLILREFDHAQNLQRLEDLRAIAQSVEKDFPGLKISISDHHQYPNMSQYIKEAPEVVDAARKAIEASGIKVLERPIRGGTDGSNLSARGILTPNIFAGGLNFHSLTEWIPISALGKCVETILNLGAVWSNKQI